MNNDTIIKDFHRQTRTAQRILVDPLAAFVAATEPEKVPYLAQQLFAGALNAACADRRWNQMATLLDAPDLAFVAFISRLRELLESWVSFHPDAVRWAEANNALLQSVVDAQLQRRTAIAMPDFLSVAEQRSDGRGTKIITLSKLYGQSSYAKAAKVAATALFGDFIAGDPSSIRFCAREGCRMPFHPSRSDQVFHPGGSCGKSVSSNRVHANDSRAENLKMLKEYASRLSRWIKRPGGDWQDALERNRRKRRLLSMCIEAAQPNGHMARKLVLERCFDTRLQSTREVEGKIDRFLSEIRKAFELQSERRTVK